MNTSHRSDVASTPCSDDAMQEALTMYVDGELGVDDQSRLFTHLAACSDCRRTLEGVMRFRRIIREENLAVPPAVDDAFLKRLRDHQQVTAPVTREPVVGDGWDSRAPVSVRTAVTVAVVVFLAGLLTPVNVSSDDVPLAWVEVNEEVIELAEWERAEATTAVYVFYPGLTVEATRSDEASPSERL